MSFWILFYLSNSWAVLNTNTSAQNSVSTFNSYKAYLSYKRKKNNFENEQKFFLKLRKQKLRIEKKKKLAQNQAYLLDFLNNVHAKELQKHNKAIPFKKLSDQEKYFLSFQKQKKNFETQRKSAFFNHKKKYQKYQKKQKDILISRLKSVSLFRNKKENKKIPVF